jgi:hypothetical protein
MDLPSRGPIYGLERDSRQDGSELTGPDTTRNNLAVRGEGVQMKMIILVVVMSGQTPAMVPGWHSMAACEAAKKTIGEKYFNTRSTYQKPNIACLEFAND